MMIENLNKHTNFDVALESAKLYLNVISRIISICSISPFDNMDIVKLKRSIITEVILALDENERTILSQIADNQ